MKVDLEKMKSDSLYACQQRLKFTEQTIANLVDAAEKDIDRIAELEDALFHANNRIAELDVQLAWNYDMDAAPDEEECLVIWLYEVNRDYLSKFGLKLQHVMCDDYPYSHMVSTDHPGGFGKVIAFRRINLPAKLDATASKE